MVIINPRNINIIAATIKSRRKSLAMTQEQLGVKAGVTQGMIAHIENGKRLPNLINLVSILSLLDLVLRVEIEK